MYVCVCVWFCIPLLVCRYVRVYTFYLYVCLSVSIWWWVWATEQCFEVDILLPTLHTLIHTKTIPRPLVLRPLQQQHAHVCWYHPFLFFQSLHVHSRAGSLSLSHALTFFVSISFSRFCLLIGRSVRLLPTFSHLPLFPANLLNTANSPSLAAPSRASEKAPLPNIGTASGTSTPAPNRNSPTITPSPALPATAGRSTSTSSSAPTPTPAYRHHGHAPPPPSGAGARRLHSPLPTPRSATAVCTTTSSTSSIPQPDAQSPPLFSPISTRTSSSSLPGTVSNENAGKRSSRVPPPRPSRHATVDSAADGIYACVRVFIYIYMCVCCVTLAY